MEWGREMAMQSDKNIIECMKLSNSFLKGGKWKVCGKDVWKISPLLSD